MEQSAAEQNGELTQSHEVHPGNRAHNTNGIRAFIDYQTPYGLLGNWTTLDIERYGTHNIGHSMQGKHRMLKNAGHIIPFSDHDKPMTLIG